MFNCDTKADYRKKAAISEDACSWEDLSGETYTPFATANKITLKCIYVNSALQVASICAENINQ